MKFICVLLVVCTVLWILEFVKEKKKNCNATVNRKNKPKENVNVEEIVNVEQVDYEVKRFRPYYRVFTLAGGTNPLLPPIISVKDGNITLTKQGYDIYVKHLNEYYNDELHWKEREQALNLFMEELFGEYLEEVKNAISFEYVADHLIKIEKRTDYSANIRLIFSDVCSLKTQAERNLFIRKLKETKIYS